MSKKIIVGITGSIAAFKSIQLISNLVKLGYQVEVLMTPSANRFVTKESIQALTKRKVYIDIFDDRQCRSILRSYYMPKKTKCVTSLVLTMSSACIRVLHHV